MGAVKVCLYNGVSVISNGFDEHGSGSGITAGGWRAACLCIGGPCCESAQLDKADFWLPHRQLIRAIETSDDKRKRTLREGKNLYQVWGSFTPLDEQRKRCMCAKLAFHHTYHHTYHHSR